MYRYTERKHKGMSMTENEKALLYATDKHVGALAQTMEQLAKSQVIANSKLEDILAVVNTQQVMAEKFDNLEINLKESFGRYGGRLDVIENYQNVTGCASLKVQATYIESVKGDLAILRKRVGVAEAKAEDTLKASTTRWVMLALFGYISAFGTYVVKDLHRIDNDRVAYSNTQAGVNNLQSLTNTNVQDTFAELGLEVQENRELLNRNFGVIQGHMDSIGKGE